MSVPSLPELQRAFSAWVLGEQDPALQKLVASRGLAPDARLQVYENIVFNNLTDALATAYPVIQALVGGAFFDAAAARYIRRHPSRRGCLQDYGADFAEMLATMPEAGGLPYLPDVARLEWARQCSALAPVENPMAPSALSLLPESSRISARLRLQSALALVRSPYPILDIWLYCQQEQEGRLDIGGPGQNLLIWRSGGQIGMQAVDAGLYAFVHALDKRQELTTACASALEVDTAFDVGMAISWLFREGIVIGCKTD